MFKFGKMFATPGNWAEEQARSLKFVALGYYMLWNFPTCFWYRYGV